MAGAVVLLLVMFVIGPILAFLAGAIWSALYGWSVGETVTIAAEAAGADTAS